MENIKIDLDFMKNKVIEYLIQTNNEDLVEEIQYFPQEDISNLFLSAYFRGEIII